MTAKIEMRISHEVGTFEFTGKAYNYWMVQAYLDGQWLSINRLPTEAKAKAFVKRGKLA